MSAESPARRGPTVIDVKQLPHTSNREAQTVIRMSDGTRIAVYATGKVKVGRDWTTLNKHDDDSVRVFNFGPGKREGGSPAASFVHLNFAVRGDKPS